jgi:hypothetical protein
MVAVEWQHLAEGADLESGRDRENASDGFREGSDCTHPEEDPCEMNVLALILELMVQDCSLPKVAEALNQQGFRTRDGSRWTAVTVYNMLPRLIEVSPEFLTTEAWMERRKRDSHGGVVGAPAES